MTEKKPVLVIGAGPAGLTAAYLLSKSGVPVTVLEADPQYVGGISRTFQYKGFRFDIGGHRFFSKSKEVEDLWTEILGPDLIERPRLSRIYYKKQFFSYPLRAGEALLKLGLLESTLCVFSYLKARAAPIRHVKSFEDWVTNQFGGRLYRIFFKTYTEKVWGMKCQDISADWAAQRIKGLSLATAIRNALAPQRKSDRTQVIKTLIDKFRYPRLGPGMMWEACAARIKANGGDVRLGCEVIGCRYSREGTWVIPAKENGRERLFSAHHLISSAPLRDLVAMLDPALSPAASQAARSLKYRDFLVVALMMRDNANIPDNWIYIHDPSVRVGRVQNFKSWSPELVPSSSQCCYGLEYFCFEGDSMWSMSDAQLIALAGSELEKIGLARREDIEDGCVVRQRKAYPVYDDNYAQNVQIAAGELASRFPTLHLVGRNGMHKYNNQDHAMMTSMLTVRNILAGSRVYDVWRVNQDAEYLEDVSISGASGERLVPAKIS